MMVVPWVLVEWLVQDQEGPVVLAPGDLGVLEDPAIWALMVQWEWDRDLRVLDHQRVQDKE